MSRAEALAILEKAIDSCTSSDVDDTNVASALSRLMLCAWRDEPFHKFYGALRISDLQWRQANARSALKQIRRAISDTTIELAKIASIYNPDAMPDGPELWVQEKQKESASRRDALAARLVRSVLPLFRFTKRGPERMASCVLVRIDGRSFAFTAGHIFDAFTPGDWLYSATEPVGKGSLIPVPVQKAVRKSTLKDGTEVDLAVILLEQDELAALPGWRFLDSPNVDLADLPDDNSLGAFYFTVGHPISPALAKLESKKPWQFNQSSFSFSSNPPQDPSAYVNAGLSPDSHLLVEFDQRDSRRSGKSFTAPKLTGISGGGIFLVHGGEQQQPKLVAVITDHLKFPRFIRGSKVKHFLALAAECDDI